jgi:hypothetical protein
MLLKKNFEKIHFKGFIHAKIPKRVILWAQVILWAPTVYVEHQFSRYTNSLMTT